MILRGKSEAHLPKSQELNCIGKTLVQILGARQSHCSKYDLVLKTLCFKRSINFNLLYYLLQGRLYVSC